MYKFHITGKKLSYSASGPVAKIDNKLNLVSHGANVYTDILISVCQASSTICLENSNYEFILVVMKSEHDSQK